MKRRDEIIGGGLTSYVVMGYLKRCGIYKGRRSIYADFTDADYKLIGELYKSSKWDELFEKYPILTKQRVYSLCNNLDIKKDEYFWSSEDIEYLRDNYNKVSLNDLVEHYNGRYTYKAISTKAKKMGFTKSRAWSEEEHEIFMNNYSTIPMDELMKLLPNRTYQSIVTRGKKYKLKTYNYLSQKYTDEQKQFVEENWQIMSDKEIADKFGKHPHGIRDLRAKMGLCRFDKEYGKYENLARLFRGHIQTWKTETMRACDYKCVLSGSDDFAIHHLYGFNMILKEAFEQIEEVIKIESDNVTDYTKEQLDTMIDIFRRVHDKYPLGVCVRRDIHCLFHQVYGSGGNTPEQWYKFQEDYKNGKYEI